LLGLEDRINQAVLAQDEVALRDVLSDYREFFVEMTDMKGDVLPLFEGKW
jgi:predicted RNA-binding protein